MTADRCGCENCRPETPSGCAEFIFTALAFVAAIAFIGSFLVGWVHQTAATEACDLVGVLLDEETMIEDDWPDLLSPSEADRCIIERGGQPVPVEDLWRESD